MMCSSIPLQQAIPVVGFTFIGPDIRSASQARFGEEREMDAPYDRPSDAAGYFTVALLFMFVVFGPAIVSLL